MRKTRFACLFLGFSLLLCSIFAPTAEGGFRRFLIRRLYPIHREHSFYDFVKLGVDFIQGGGLQNLKRDESQNRETNDSSIRADADLDGLEQKLNELTAKISSTKNILDSNPSPFIKTTPLTQPASRETAMAVCIGVVNRRPDLGSSAVPGAKNDAYTMSSILRTNGFKSEKIKILIDSQATASEVKKHILNAATIIPANGLFVMTYAGHGTYVTDTNGDEQRDNNLSDHDDEAWCLYDRSLIDDELPELWAKFRPGVRIVVVLDSCHSGSGTRDVPAFRERVARSLVDSKLKSRGETLPEDEHKEEVQKIAEKLHPRVLNDQERVKDWAINDAVYRDVNESSAREESPQPGGPLVLLLAACQDHEVSWGGNNGVFTTALAGVVSRATSYNDLHRLILENMPRPDQHPNKYFFPKSEESSSNGRKFLDQNKPFVP